MTIRIAFCDLSHTGQIVAANTFPFGISLVAAYAKQRFKERIDVELFKLPSDFSKYIENNSPDIVCFSNFLWNSQLNAFFARRIKEVRPRTIIIFGGPNYSAEPDDQKKFLLSNPMVDFYIWLEGERPFAALLEGLFADNFDVTAIKNKRKTFGSVHYAVGDEIIRGDLLPRIEDLDEIPSPYCMGILDKFFNDIFIPVMETNRGCPFQCTFCEIGRKFFNKVRRHSPERIREELRYIAERVPTPDLLVADSNFGMYPEDLETCEIIAELQREFSWPKFVLNSSGKNQKERVLEAARILNGAMVLTVSIQSADKGVLANVKRDNISLEQIVAIGKSAERLGASTYCEIILGLPGDSLEAHFHSVRTMIDAEINNVLTYQAMMLPGSEISDAAYREKFGLVTRFRVLPRCFGSYGILGATDTIFETEGICVAQDTMSYVDYLTCRSFNLSVELFNNSGAFRELTNLLKMRGINPSQLIQRAHEIASKASTGISEVYAGFIRENEDKLWENREDLYNFLKTPGIIDDYISGKLGSSEMYKYRTIAFFNHQDQLHSIAFEAARNLLSEKGELNQDVSIYLNELQEFSLIRKKDLLDTSLDYERDFSFDFVALENSHFADDPFIHKGSVHRYRVSHTDEQSKLIAAYVRQYGTTVDGLGRFLLRTHVNRLYRKPRYGGAAAPGATPVH